MPSGRLLVVCKGDERLEVIDLASGERIHRVRASGITPHEVTASGDGRRGYLPIYSDAWLGLPGTDGRAIDVIDLVDGDLIDTIRLDFASRPHLPLLGPHGTLFVGTELDESLSVFNLETGIRTARLPTGRPQSHMFVLSPDGARAYTANVSSGSMSAIDVAGGTLIGVVELCNEVNRISISPDGRTAFLADQESPRIAMVDLERLELAQWIDLPSRAFGTRVTSDGSLLILALRWEAQLAILDLAALQIIATVDVPSQPQAVVIDPTDRWAYSACDADDVVVEVDLLEPGVSRTFTTGREPDGIWWAPEPAAST